MAVQTVNVISRTGLNLDSVAVAADAGLTEKWAGTGAEFLYVLNGGGSSITVTLNIPTTIDGQAVTAKTVTIAAAEHALIGPFNTSYYNDSNGNVNITWSAVTSVKLAVCKLGS